MNNSNEYIGKPYWQVDINFEKVNCVWLVLAWVQVDIQQNACQRLKSVETLKQDSELFKSQSQSQSQPNQPVLPNNPMRKQFIFIYLFFLFYSCYILLIYQKLNYRQFYAIINNEIIYKIKKVNINIKSTFYYIKQVNY